MFDFYAFFSMLPATPGWALFGLFLAAFLAATLLPGGSELAFAGLLHLHPEWRMEALAAATLGNTLGGLSSYAIGRLLPGRAEAARVDWLRRWGSPALLLSWAPLVGDALCVAAGWLRLPLAAATLFIALGKFARYWLIAQAF